MPRKGALPFLRPPRAQPAPSAHGDRRGDAREPRTDRSRSGGARKGSLLDAVDRTVTGAGARLLAADLAAPLIDRARDRGAARSRRSCFHDDAGAARRRCAPRCARCPISAARSAGSSAGRGSPRDLGQLRDGLDGARRLRERLGAIEPTARRCSTSLLPRSRGHGALIDLLTRALVPSPPIERGAGRLYRRGL